MELQRFNEALANYIRPQTYPVAVRMVSSTEQVPEKARKPKRDMGVTMPLCQGISLARRRGWLIAMGEEDMLCAIGALTLGFLPAKHKFLDGSFKIPFFMESQGLRAKVSRNLPRLEYRKYDYVVASPINRADFEPHVVVVYGNPAQISRLILTAFYITGDFVTSSSWGGAACCTEITAPILTDQCQVIIAGGGDRVMAQAHDHEAAFAIPGSKIDDFIRGLEQTDKAGVKYPVPSFLTYQAQFLPAFGELIEYLRQSD